MADRETPLSRLDPDGKPAVINYNVPEPTSYTGENIIELDLDEDWFTERAFETPDSTFDNLEPPPPGTGPVRPVPILRRPSIPRPSTP